MAAKLLRRTTGLIGFVALLAAMTLTGWAQTATSPSAPNISAEGVRTAGRTGAAARVGFPPQVFINPSLEHDAIGPAPTSGYTTQDGSLIAPAETDGRLSPAQIQDSAAAAQPEDGTLQSAPPAIAIDGEGHGAIVSGVSIQ